MVRKTSPRRARKTSPRRARKTSPRRARKTSPRRARKTSPRRARKTSPRRARKTSPRRARKTSPRRTKRRMYMGGRDMGGRDMGGRDMGGRYTSGGELRDLGGEHGVFGDEYRPRLSGTDKQVTHKFLQYYGGCIMRTISKNTDRDTKRIKTEYLSDQNLALECGFHRDDFEKIKDYIFMRHENTYCRGSSQWWRWDWKRLQENSSRL